MNYVILTTQDGDRWDLLAWRAYGDALAVDRLIAANPHIAIAPTLPGGLQVWCPVVASPSTAVPPWKS